MACCSLCQGSLKGHRTQASALEWGLVMADPGPCADPYYRAASVENVISRSWPSGDSTWPRQDIHDGLTSFYLADGPWGGSGAAPPPAPPQPAPPPPVTTPPATPPPGTQTPTFGDPVVVKKPACCCKVVSAKITVTNVDADSPKNKYKDGSAYTMFDLKVTLNWQPGKKDPKPCDMKWQERTTKAYNVPPDENGKMVAGAVTVEPGPEVGGKSTLSLKWVDVSKPVKKMRGSTPRGSGNRPSFKTLMKAKNCPKNQLFYFKDEARAPKALFPRDLLIKVTLTNGKECPGTTVLKLMQHIGADGKVTSQPTGGTTTVPGGTTMADPPGWSEPIPATSGAGGGGR